MAIATTKVDQRGPLMSADSRDDEALLLAVARQDDRMAYAELYRRYARSAYGMACRIESDPVRAEDAVQEALVRVWLSAKSYRPGGRPRSWIMRIVVREVLKLRQMTEQKRKTDDLSLVEDSLGSDDRVSEKSEQVASIGKALERLPFKDRCMVLLYFSESQSQEQIGKTLGISQREISRRLKDALESMRGSLSKMGYASALPLLSSGLLFDMLTEEASLPVHLKDKVQAGIDAEQSHRPAGLEKIVKPVIALVCCVAFGVMLFLFSGDESPSVSQDMAVKSSTSGNGNSRESERIESQTRFPLSYSFDDLIFPDAFERQLGSYGILPDKGVDGTPCLQIETTYAKLRLPVSQHELPLIITMKTWLRPPKPPNAFMGRPTWNTFAIWGEFSNCGAEVNVRPKTWIDTTYYISRHFIVGWCKGVRTNVSYFRPLDSSHLCLVFRGKRNLDNLIIRRPEPNEIPDLEAFKKAIEGLSESQMVGAIPMPEIPSVRLPELVYLKFNAKK